MSLFGRTTPRHAPRPVNLLPTDIPRFESQRIAADVLAPGPHPSMRDGKGQQPHLIGDTPATDEAWEAHLAPVLELCRPRKNRCVACDGAGTVKATSPGGKVAWYCLEDKPRGVFGVVDGGGAA